MPPAEFLGLNLPRELIVLLIAVLPIFELRGALPVAINVFGFPWYYALFLAVIGNLLPVPFLLLFLDRLARLLSRVPLFARMFPHSGLYVCRLTAGRQSRTLKLVYLR